LHRSISPGLVEAIIADRPDSHFVILTHDLELAAALGESGGQVYSLTRCSWAGQNARGWELLPVDASAEMSESARAAILGGRRRLLFIEGEKCSLDLRLYELLFPDWTLLPQGGCDQVIRAVIGLCDSQSHHWLNACGIVDGDGRTEEEKSSLGARGILALSVSEVENLYYSDAVMKAVGARQAETVDETADTLISQARAGALKALGDHNAPERLAAVVALAVLRRRVLEELPTSVDATAATITVSSPSPYPAILSRIVALLDAVILTASSGLFLSGIPLCVTRLHVPFGSRTSQTTKPVRVRGFVRMRLSPRRYVSSSVRCRHDTTNEVGSQFTQDPTFQPLRRLIRNAFPGSVPPLRHEDSSCVQWALVLVIAWLCCMWSVWPCIPR
jgi:hypothetical protein